jgi:nitroreductase
MVHNETLSPDELLSTTRAVRRRLDFTRPVPVSVVRECVELALQAPSASDSVTMQFVVVRDPALRAAVAEQYRDAFAAYRGSPRYAQAKANKPRLTESADFLADNLEKAPILVIGCNRGPTRESAEREMSNILPAMWSFMLAARARGLGTAWTTAHVYREREVAKILSIPYDTVKQVVLTPLAYTQGTTFRPARRPPADDVIEWR